MSFSYASGSGESRDRIRSRIGDTDSSVPETQRLEDEEIEDFLVTEGSWRAAASTAALALAAKFARLATTKTAGALTIVWQKRYDGLVQLAGQLKRSAVAFAAPSAGGISIASKAVADADPDRVLPAFKVGMLDNKQEGAS